MYFTRVFDSTLSPLLIPSFAYKFCYFPLLESFALLFKWFSLTYVHTTEYVYTYVFTSHWFRKMYANCIYCITKVFFSLISDFVFSSIKAILSFFFCLEKRTIYLTVFCAAEMFIDSRETHRYRLTFDKIYMRFGFTWVVYDTMDMQLVLKNIRRISPIKIE